LRAAPARSREQRVTPKYTALTDELHAYLVENGSREDAILASLREETAAMGDISVMQIAPDQGAFMTLLTQLTGARLAIELGTFTGYSAICIARGLSEGGKLVACELSEEFAELAAKNFERAGVGERVELRIGPAAETLAELGPPESFDLAFIDADKGNNPEYFEACMRLLRPGGLIVIDNVLLDGRVLSPDPDDDDPNAVVVDRFNRSLLEDQRIDLAMIAVADGLTLARKR